MCALDVILVGYRGFFINTPVDNRKNSMSQESVNSRNFIPPKLRVDATCIHVQAPAIIHLEVYPIRHLKVT